MKMQFLIKFALAFLCLEGVQGKDEASQPQLRGSALGASQTLESMRGG
eukprot:CAMPEP_0114663812 /NCGR_PEP_ID=MMETSP0191-20121206/27624_1 /TAXON_ID=126664 /ORGANISM="Sorites sp." /LENGTH=47 /DNA_ID= /DNA_START= /DNA_END= /DNA_ORIENTATION=